MPLPFAPMGLKTNELFISPLRYGLLYEILMAPAFQVSLGVGSGVDFAAYGYLGSLQGGWARSLAPQDIARTNLAGLASLYKTQTDELRAELETTLGQQKKLNR